MPLLGTLPYEERLAAQLVQAATHLQSTGQPIDDPTLRVWTGVGLKTLQRHPAAREVLRRLEADALYEREIRLLEQVETAIHHLQAQGGPVYREDIYQLVGVSGQVLRSYPRIRERLYPLNRSSPTKKPTRSRRCEAMLLKQTQHIIQQLVDQETSVTQEQIAAALGLRLAYIHRAYPQVYALLKQTKAIRSEQSETELLAGVDRAIQSLQSEQQVVTRKVVARLLGVSVATLSRYPRVREHLKQVCDEQIAAQKGQRVASVVEAINHLQRQGQMLTQATICHQVGLSESAARYHAELKCMIDPVLAAQRTQQEQQLVQRVTVAIAKLRQQGQKVSMPAVCRLVGMSLAGLRDYPQVVEQVRQARLECRREYEAQLVTRIGQAISQMEHSGKPLTQKAICEAIALSPNTLRYYHRAKALVDAVASRYHQEQHTPWHERYRRPK